MKYNVYQITIFKSNYMYVCMYLETHLYSWYKLSMYSYFDY